ncbi:hypothetical protein E2C01_099261 [Portunus trituberculatus]|uniref:Uncharacterized protein n=1 Tax=Portunus trituberculatus TaxID=210409 RepID=A0A5B7KEZ9_PORTR|nr:hypothetical protein [Portunus trituberculatus]
MFVILVVPHPASCPSLFSSAAHQPDPDVPKGRSSEPRPKTGHPELPPAVKLQSKAA